MRVATASRLPAAATTRGVQHLAVPARQRALEAPLELARLLRIALGVSLEQPRPLGLAVRARAPGVPRRVDVLRHLERLVRPVDRLARRRDLGVAERFAVRLLGAGAPRRTLADDRLRDDQRRLVAALALRDRLVDGIDVVAVDRPHHVPAVRAEALRGVVGEPVLDLAVDRDSIVVVDRDELVELPGAGQRRRFMRNAFHHATVAEQHIGPVIDDVEAGPVELGCQQFLRQRHADRIGETLSERSGGGLDARCDAVLGMTRRAAPHLAEVHQFLHRQVVAREMQQRVLQHRAVAVGQDEAIPVGPLRVRGVVGEVPPPQRDGDFRHPHRHAGMPRVRLLHSIHGQRADRVGHLHRALVRERARRGGVVHGKPVRGKERLGRNGPEGTLKRPRPRGKENFSKGGSAAHGFQASGDGPHRPGFRPCGSACRKTRKPEGSLQPSAGAISSVRVQMADFFGYHLLL